MIIKAHIGDGAWALYDRAADVQFLGPHSRVDIPDGDHDFISDDHIPYRDGEVLHVHLPGGVLADSDHQGQYRCCRWVKWLADDGQPHTLVTDGTVFICNDQGDTIESLR